MHKTLFALYPCSLVSVCGATTTPLHQNATEDGNGNGKWEKLLTRT